MYHDLNLAYADAEASLHRERICVCLSLGYSAVASATSVAERLSSGSKCSTSDVEDASIAAGGVHLHRQLKLGGSFRPGRAGHTVLRQLTRLNFIASDPAQTQQLSTSQQVVRTYDLVAIVPRSERVLQQVGQRGQRQGGWCRCMSARTPSAQQPTRSVARAAQLPVPRISSWAGCPQHLLRPQPCWAVQPTRRNACRPAQQACSSLDVDIISLELHQRLPFKLKPNILKPALARGVSGLLAQEHQVQVH